MTRFALAGGKPQALAILDALHGIGLVPERLFAAHGLPDDDHAALTHWAGAHAVPLHESKTIAPALLDDLDVLILCRFELVPSAIFDAPRLGAINVHSALLPRYRGVHPVSWALIDGADETGVTIHRVDDGVDTGTVVTQRRLPIRDDHDLGSLTRDLDALSGRAMAEVFETILETGALPPSRPQVGPASRAPRRRPEDGRIDWRRDARAVFNLVRALPSPLPSAFTFDGPRRIEVPRCRLSEGAVSAGVPGTVLGRCDDRVVVRCGDGRRVEVTTRGPVEVGAVLQ